MSSLAIIITLWQEVKEWHQSLSLSLSFSRLRQLNLTGDPFICSMLSTFDVQNVPLMSRLSILYRKISVLQWESKEITRVCHFDSHLSEKQFLLVCPISQPALTIITLWFLERNAFVYVRQWVAKISCKNESEKRIVTTKGNLSLTFATSDVSFSSFPWLFLDFTDHHHETVNTRHVGNSNSPSLVVPWSWLHSMTLQC